MKLKEVAILWKLWLCSLFTVFLVPVQTPTTDLEAPNPANTRSTKSLKVEPVVFDPEKIMALGDEENENDSDDVDLLTSQRKLVQEAFAGDNVVKVGGDDKCLMMLLTRNSPGI